MLGSLPQRCNLLHFMTRNAKLNSSREILRLNVKSTSINLTQLLRRAIGGISFQERGERVKNTAQSVLDAIRLKKGFFTPIKSLDAVFSEKIRFLGDRGQS